MDFALTFCINYTCKLPYRIKGKFLNLWYPVRFQGNLQEEGMVCYVSEITDGKLLDLKFFFIKLPELLMLVELSLQESCLIYFSPGGKYLEY